MTGSLDMFSNEFYLNEYNMIIFFLITKILLLFLQKKS